MSTTTIPTDTRFTLVTAIDTVPAGATGQLTRLDSYHVALAFDNYQDLVFDVQDTDPAIWSSIKPTTQPSMTDPPCCTKPLWVSLVSVFVTALIATLVLYCVVHGVVITFVSLFVLALLRDLSLRWIFTP